MKCYPTELATKLEDLARMISESIPKDYDFIKETAEGILEELGDGK